eukprot:1391087-Amorphochlora_amoeboformis.AAC.1
MASACCAMCDSFGVSGPSYQPSLTCPSSRICSPCPHGPRVPFPSSEFQRGGMNGYSGDDRGGLYGGFGVSRHGWMDTHGWVDTRASIHALFLLCMKADAGKGIEIGARTRDALHTHDGVPVRAHAGAHAARAAHAAHAGARGAFGARSDARDARGGCFGGAVVSEFEVGVGWSCPFGNACDVGGGSVAILLAWCTADVLCRGNRRVGDL